MIHTKNEFRCRRRLDDAISLLLLMLRAIHALSRERCTSKHNHNTTDHCCFQEWESEGGGGANSFDMYRTRERINFAYSSFEEKKV